MGCRIIARGLVVAASLWLAACATRYHIADVHEANALSNKGFDLFEAGDSKGAMDALNAVIAYGTLEDRDYTRRATVEASLKQYEKALADNDRALELAPHEWRTHLQRAVLHQRVRQFDAAILDLDKAVYEAPTQTDLLRRRAYLKVVAGRFRDAAADYDLLAETPSQRESGILGRGVALYLDGAWRDAADVFDGILKSHPGDGLTALWLAKSSLRAGSPVDPARFTGRGEEESEEATSWVMADTLFTVTRIEDANAKIKPLENRGLSPCERLLFQGAWRLLRSGGDGAAAAFQAAQKECPADSIEGAEARAELARLKG